VTTKATRQALPWFNQAASDTRTAQALLPGPKPMEAKDVGCHIAALCSQALEKSLKGYMLLNGSDPRFDHRPDKYLVGLLATDASPLLKYKDHRSHLAKLFTPETKDVVRTLLALTPGGRGRMTDAINTEYPWKEEAEWRQAPCDHGRFSDRSTLKSWVDTTQRVRDVFYKLWNAVDRVTG
jgi:hypothetical protein